MGLEDEFTVASGVLRGPGLVLVVGNASVCLGARDDDFCGAVD
jgi:hypothetical protein